MPAFGILIRMYAEERKRQIASLTAVEGRVSVADLAEKFDVTAETIRRDLTALHAEGVVHRVHGGAVVNQAFLTTELPLDARSRSASAAKTPSRAKPSNSCPATPTLASSSTPAQPPNSSPAFCPSTRPRRTSRL